MERHACSEAVACMQAYYKACPAPLPAMTPAASLTDSIQVARKTLVDAVPSSIAFIRGASRSRPARTCRGPHPASHGFASAVSTATPDPGGGFMKRSRPRGDDQQEGRDASSVTAGWGGGGAAVGDGGTSVEWGSRSTPHRRGNPIRNAARGRDADDAGPCRPRRPHAPPKTTGLLREPPAARSGGDHDDSGGYHQPS